MNPKINFQNFNRIDLPACARIGVDVFPLYRGRFTGEEVGKVMKAHINSCYAISTYNKLAIIDDKVVGFLFGRIKRNFNPFKFLKQILLIAVCYIRGAYGNKKKLIRFIKPCIQEAKELNRNMPPNEGAVVLFAVAPKYQNRGIGRTLMDNFIHHALKCGISILSVPTDETVSYWFYERYGFRRWTEFKDSLLSYCADRPIKGFTYQLVLHKSNIV